MPLDAGGTIGVRWVETPKVLPKHIESIALIQLGL